MRRTQNAIQEQERVKRELAVVIKQDGSLRQQVSVMKASHDTDARAADDARRRVAALLEEGSALKESESKVKNNLQ